MSKRFVGILVAVAAVVSLFTILLEQKSATHLGGGEPRISVPGEGATPKKALDSSRPEHAMPAQGSPSGEVVAGGTSGSVASAEERSRQAMKQLVDDSFNQGRWTTLHDEAFDTLLEQAPQGLREELLRARHEARASRQGKNN